MTYFHSSAAVKWQTRFMADFMHSENPSSVEIKGELNPQRTLSRDLWMSLSFFLCGEIRLKNKSSLWVVVVVAVKFLICGTLSPPCYKRRTSCWLGVVFAWWSIVWRWWYRPSFGRRKRGSWSVTWRHALRTMSYFRFYIFHQPASITPNFYQSFIHELNLDEKEVPFLSGTF